MPKNPEVAIPRHQELAVYARGHVWPFWARVLLVGVPRAVRRARGRPNNAEQLAAQ